MKFDWENWNTGGRIIFVAGCVATASMLMKWTDAGFISQTGLTQGAILFLGLWVYPFLMLFKNKSIERVWGLVCSIGSVIGAIAYIADKSGTFMGRSVSFAGTGAWVFLIASGALIYGVLQYRPSKAD